MLWSPSCCAQAAAGLLSAAVAEGKLQDKATAGLLIATERGDFASVQDRLANGADIEALDEEVCAVCAYASPFLCCWVFGLASCSTLK